MRLTYSRQVLGNQPDKSDDVRIGTVRASLENVLHISDCTETVVFQFEDVVGIIERFLDTGKAHRVGLGKHLVMASQRGYYHGRIDFQFQPVKLRQTTKSFTPRTCVLSPESSASSNYLASVSI
jgi:hypothetical protein